MKLLVLLKPTSWGDIIKKFIEENFKDYLIITGDWGDPIPNNIFSWKGDHIISFLSPWILPDDILNNAKVAAINFHPAPPKYPGIGCYNFAIYNGVKKYGVTCHHMVTKVDSGKIIAVKRFPLYRTETVLTLKQKSMVYLTMLFYEIMDLILNGLDLPESNENWEREPYKRVDFQELCKLSFTMSEEQLLRRLRATYFQGALDYPFLMINGQKYLLVKPDELKKKERS